MTRPNAGDFPIDPTQVDGSELADRLNRLYLAITSEFAGQGTPPTAQPGMAWTRDNGDGTFTLMIYDGTQDIPIATTKADGSASASSFYTKAEIDAMIAAINQSVSQINSMPQGGIIQWSGALANIPAGYALCDGSNGTPDLSDKFIVAAGGTYSVGDEGGKDTLTDIPQHAHGVSLTTNTQGGHNHGGDTGGAGDHNHQAINISNNSGEGFSVANAPAGKSVTYDGSGGGRDITDSGGELSSDIYTSGPRYGSKNNGGGNHKHNISTDGGHNHTVAGNTENTGTSGGVDIRPPYFALAFIMKT